MKSELLDGEQLLAEEMANLFRGWEGVGGRLYVTNRRVIFESHLLNFQRGVTEIPLEEIEDVSAAEHPGVRPQRHGDPDARRTRFTDSSRGAGTGSST